MTFTDNPNTYHFTVWCSKTDGKMVEADSMNHAVAKYAGCDVHFEYTDDDNVTHYIGDDDRQYKVI